VQKWCLRKHRWLIHMLFLFDLLSFIFKFEYLNSLKTGVCSSGYELKDNNCEDVNECARNRDLCANGACVNTNGSYYCKCPTGLTVSSDQTQCVDINECTASITSPCINSECINTKGSFFCHCTIPGTVLDNSQRNCVDNRKGLCWTEINRGKCEANLAGEVTKAECCSTIGKAWGSPCTLCSDITSGWKKNYLNFYTKKSYMIFNNFMKHFLVTARPGSTVVPVKKCPPGHILSGTECQDINECNLFSNICGPHGLCVNTKGSYKCDCPPHLKLDSTGRNCIGNERKF